MRPHFRIIYINPEEEIMSLIGRLRGMPAQDFILVIPQASRFLESLINLQLLQRQMERSGKNIAIATQDVRGVASAKRVGIEVVSMETVFEISGEESRISPQELQNEKQKFSQEKELSRNAYDIPLGGGVVDHSNFSPKRNRIPNKDISPKKVQKQFVRPQTSDGIRRQVSDMQVAQDFSPPRTSPSSESTYPKKVSSIRPPQTKNQATGNNGLQFHNIPSQEREKARVIKGNTQRKDSFLSQQKSPQEHSPQSDSLQHREVQEHTSTTKRKKRKILKRKNIIIGLTLLVIGGASLTLSFFWKYIPEANISVSMKQLKIQGMFLLRRLKRDQVISLLR